MEFRRQQLMRCWIGTKRHERCADECGRDSGPGLVYKWPQEGPMTTITPELRHAIEQAGDAPVQITDPETQAAYIIVKAEVYERMRALCGDSDVRDFYPMMNEVAAREGWDDPAMDIDDDYQPPSN